MNGTESWREPHAHKARWRDRFARWLRRTDWVLFPLLVGFVVVFMGALLIESANCGTKACTLLAVADWFDPVFFQYNLVLLFVAVMVVPGVTFAYLLTMADRKKGRLKYELDNADLPDELREDLKRKVDDLMEKRLRLGSYFGSVLLATLVVLLGASIILLFKPAFPPDHVGVDFTRGANVLMMGPYIDLLAGDAGTYYARLSWSLVAFQFGFLGAYLYFVSSLARAYFTLDLTPHTFVAGSIRMMLASVLALVVSFIPGLYDDSVPRIATVLPTAAESLKADLEARPAAEAKEPAAAAAKDDASLLKLSLVSLPLVSFFFGFYPKRAMAFIERVVTTIMRSSVGESYRAMPLAMLGGMSLNHEIRLETEGLDNLENLSHANALGLAVRTGLSFGQLRQWVGEAWLASHLREDYHKFVDRTGITSREELGAFFASQPAAPAAIEQLVASSPEAEKAGLKVKLASLAALLGVKPPAP